jgi:DNA topoisomerase-6 subunit B
MTAVRIEVENHSDLVRAFKLHEVISQEASSVIPTAKMIPLGDSYDYYWKLSLGPGEKISLCYSIRSVGARFTQPVVEGLESEIVTGARVI